MVYAYERVYQEIRHQIEEGVYKKDFYLPPEDQLCVMFSVSRITIRKAIKKLVSESFLSVKQGRGTVVLDPVISQNLNSVTSFTATLINRGYKVGVASSYISKELPTKEIADILGIEETTEVYKIQRIQLANNEPIGILTNYLVSDLFLGLEDIQESFVSLYSHLIKHYKIKMSFAHDKITAKTADFMEANILKIPIGSPLLVNNRITYCEGKAFEYVLMIVNAQRYEFSVIVNSN